VQRAEIRDAGRVAGTTLGGGVEVVRDVHLGVADRIFGLVGPSAEPVRAVHDGISRAVYATLGRFGHWGPRLGAAAAAVAVPESAPSWSAGRAGNVATGALNGLWGDRLAERDNALAIAMAVRHHHGDVPLTTEGLLTAFPAPTGHVVVFVHGLCETEDAWFPSDRKQVDDGAAAFGPRLADEAGCTPVYLRYNTGRHVSDNGALLSALLDELVAAWPVAVDELSLVGHSMGGLVLRSATHLGDQAGAPWVERTRHVFCLGTPHLGSPLERGANALAHALGRLPETEPVAAVLNGRSAGIKDLRYGSLIEDDWRGVDPDEFLTDRCGEVPFVATVSYYFVGVTVTRSPRHPVGWLAGDLLVQFSSASGRGRRRQIPFELDNGHHLGGLHHLDLLSHPAVYHQLARWLAVPGPAAT